MTETFTHSDTTMNKYNFITQQGSIFPMSFPKTTQITNTEKDADITIISDIIVNCENNFTSDEKKTIDDFNINNIEELIRNEKISQIDKTRSLKCFAYVRDRYELMGIEPQNGHNMIQLGKYGIDVRILPDGTMKYCKSLGETDIHNDYATYTMC